MSHHMFLCQRLWRRGVAVLWGSNHSPYVILNSILAFNATDSGVSTGEHRLLHDHHFHSIIRSETDEQTMSGFAKGSPLLSNVKQWLWELRAAWNGQMAQCTRHNVRFTTISRKPWLDQWNPDTWTPVFKDTCLPFALCTSATKNTGVPLVYPRHTQLLGGIRPSTIS